MNITIDRAIEILDPEHRERYKDLPDGMEQVNEACRMGMEALIRERDGGDDRHGYWEAIWPCNGREDLTCYRCSSCQCVSITFAGKHIPTRCCWCGARMDREVADDGI